MFVKIEDEGILTSKKAEPLELRPKIVTYCEIHSRRCSLTSIVLAENWPSWSYILNSLGWHNQLILVRNPLPQIIDLFSKNIVAFDDWRSLSTVDSTLDVVIWIQGSLSFCVDAVSYFSDLNLSCLGWNLITRSTEQSSLSTLTLFKAMEHLNMSWHWSQLKHHCLGGITNSTWTFGTTFNVPLSALTKISLIKRFMNDILSPTLKGRSIELTNETPNPNFVSLESLSRDMFIIAPSVFSCSGWIKRKLTIREKAAAYDLPVHMVQNSKLEELVYFEYSAPGKILYRIISEISKVLDPKFWEETKTSFKNSFDISVLLDKLKLSDDEALKLKREQDIKAAKNDDAEIDTSPWDTRVFSKFPHITFLKHIQKPHLNVLREKLLLRRYRRNIYNDTISYIKEKHGHTWFSQYLRIIKRGKRKIKPSLLLDLEVARDCLWRSNEATWWEYTCGSTLLFWRWPVSARKYARDGYPIHIISPLPSYRKMQRWDVDEIVNAKMIAKLRDVCKKKYIAPGFIKSLTGFFSVPKGIGDIRMVYDATACGLNDCVWAPNFFLPTVKSLTRSLISSTWMGDLDLGEMFLNFHSDRDLHPFVGVDLTELALKDGQSVKQFYWEGWTRMLMGFKPSPYNAIQGALIGEEIVRGDRRDKDNFFRWDKFILNLPDSPNYEPTLPWGFKWNDLLQSIANELYKFVDDLCVNGSTEDQCQKAMRQDASRFNYLGIQEEARKTRDPSLTPGAWSGNIIENDGKNIWVTCSQEKWNKAKAMIQLWLAHFDSRNPLFDHKSMERGRVFFGSSSHNF